uniref:Replication timing regulatory factor 1 n=1 Tax=Maylandia zebra TaxID=106582 RepID=A0A3P9D0A1_9CICH
MATAGPLSNSSFLPLLESLEDSTAGQSEQTDAYLTIANRLSGEEGRQFLPAVEKHFSRLGKAHITSPNAELSQAALQALGFCVYHSHVVSGVSGNFMSEILSALCLLVSKATDKNTCTRALWVISKQSFPAEEVPSILGTLESVWKREDIHSVVMEHEALNVIIRMLEQVPTQMGEGAVQWAKLVIPLVVHSASKVRLRAATAMEMGMPLLLEKQNEVSAVIETMMSTKLIPELQKLFMSKNETNVLKLWPLFVKLLGKLLHRGGPFINSLLHLEELGFRSSSPTIKKIAFLAWKSLIDNFALNPDILCSAKRMKLLMQPLTSINVRTEALLLTKVEVWWYLVIQLGPNLSPNFDQVRFPVCTPSRTIAQNSAAAPGTPKTGFNSPANTSRMSLNSSIQLASSIPSIQLLGLEMLLHYFRGPEVVATAAKHKLILSLEPLNHPLLSGASSFTKHAAVLISNTRDGFINIGKDAPGNKKERQGSEVLTLMLQALQSIITSESLPADRVLVLFEATVKGIPQRVLSSASYQVGKMDVLNGTPALFLILLLYDSSMLPAYVEDERFYHCLQTLVNCGLSGPTSPLAFAESLLGAISRSATSLQNKEQLLRMWSVVVSSLTDIVTQTNEVNQGDALEHNFSAMHSALMLPITHLLHSTPLPQLAQKSMLSSWSKLYKVFACCSALVVTAEENICCEELCAKMDAAIDREALRVPSTCNAVASILHVMVECVDFSPYTPQFQQKLKSPHTPVNWMRKRNKALGNLSMFQSLLVQCLEVYLEDPETSSEAVGSALLSVLSALFTNLVLANVVQEALNSLIHPLTLLYKNAASEPSKFTSQLLGKLEKLLGEVFNCLQSRSSLAHNDELLALLSPLLCVVFPHKNKHLRTSVTQFWNSTFANAVSLTYPDEMRPVLSQVKQKTPIILPGFEVVSYPDELSGQYSSENSQLETKLSGMPVSSVGKRDSLLGKTAELKEKSSMKTNKPVSTKLDFGSPKPPRREVLEEEASIDFVFIPPEAKERVLTEHQKEVKRTKRVDIPAMYNNLDASLDTTAFTQYTQSQEDSLDKLPTEQVDVVNKKTTDKVTKQKLTENGKQQETIPECADVSMEEHAKSDDRGEDVDKESKEGTSPNISPSSDLVSGTPQKPNSRRQSFITLEKYVEGKPASPSTASSFTGPLLKISNSQEPSKTSKTSASRDSSPVTCPNSQDSQSIQTGKSSSQCSVNNADESPRRPKDCRTKTEPVKLTERLSSDSMEDENVIPDTQTEMESTKRPSISQDIIPSSQEEESQSALEDSQSSPSQTSPSEPRRSGRQRVRPQLPGEDPEEREAKYSHVKKRRSGEEPISDSPKSLMQSRPNTRSKQAAEDTGREGLLNHIEKDKESDTDSKAIILSPQTGGESQKSENNGEKPKNSEMVISSPQVKGQSQESEPIGDAKKDSQVVTTSPTNKSQVGSSTTNILGKELLKDEDNELESREDSQVITPSSTDSPSKRRSRRSKVSSEVSNSHITNSVVGQADARIGGRTRRSKLLEEQLKSSPSSTPESSQSLDLSGSESSQGRGRYSRRRSSPALMASMESSESESSEVREHSVIPKKKRGRPRASLQRLLAVESKDTIEKDMEKFDTDASQELDSQITEAKDVTDLEESKTQDSPSSELIQHTNTIEAQSKEELPMEVDDVLGPEPQADDSKQRTVPASETEQRDSETNGDDSTTQNHTGDLEMIESVEVCNEQTLAPPNEATHSVQVRESPEEKADEVVTEKQMLDLNSGPRGPPEENTDTQMESLKVTGDLSEEEQHAASIQHSEASAEKETTPPQENEKAGQSEIVEDEQNTASTDALTDVCKTSLQSEPTSKGDFLDSPVKQKDLETVMAPDIGHSPSSGKTRGTWSPSASPSTSILKKGQKRPLEVDTPSPLVKSRRVSFANPIQQQETADDIDRRSPAIRTSSPRRSRVTNIPQPKHVTTPTKGLVILNPRNLHSPGYKSSKKCLISEMGQEPRPVSRDCIYPALVGCSTPVEAVLPQISSNMWSRGFGQLVRARNIKTIGDLSALTPSEIKTLPIRSPKISNVKKALKIYEQQRKGRGGDELKSFDETEMMTSELEETSVPQNIEEDKPSGDTLDERPEQDASGNLTPEVPDGDETIECQLPRDSLSSEIETLSCRMTPQELSVCSPQQLVEMHDQLGGMMRRVVVELRAVLTISQTDDL